VRASETVVTNLRVLALDQRLDAHEPIREASGNVAPIPVARTATLEVTPREAEMVTLATTLGALSLVLNSVRDGGDAATAGTEREAIANGATTGTDDLPRAMTLDSDVTSLLLPQTRRAAEGQAPVAAPGAEVVQPTRIQIVRGIDRSEVEFSRTAAAAENPAVAPPPDASLQ
jgi:Flp pilus assembly protein CpaB